VTVDTSLVGVGIHDDVRDAAADSAFVGGLQTEAGSSDAVDTSDMERGAAGA
jgi:hypothetical protein